MRSDLHHAYLHTTYTADTPAGRIEIRINHPTPALDALLQQHGVKEWCYITAHNPGSKKLPQNENESRQENLHQTITACGLALFAGQALADNNSWPPEPSLLVLDIDEPTALNLAHRFGQLAIVTGRTGEPARLVWIE